MFLLIKNKILKYITAVFLLALSITLFLNFTFQNEITVSTQSTLNLLNFWNAGRSYPSGKVESNVLMKAHSFSVSRLENKLNKTNEPDPWKAIGPDNIGGRTLAIAINPKNPSTIYAGSAGGGLWRSYTGGVGADAWDYVSTGFPVLAVSSIAIDPVDTNRIYIGTGEVYNLNNTGTGYADKLTIGSYGIGIIKTSDGGASWENSLNWADSFQVGINAIKIDPNQKSVIWAATTEGTYKSNNYGDSTSWSRVHDIKMATDLVISPTNPNKVFVVCGNLESPDNGLFKTEDGGVAWSNSFLFPSIPSVYLLGKTRIDISKSNPDILFTASGYGDYEKNTNTITWSYKTDNGGQFWIPTPASNPGWASYNAWYSHDVAINPQNPDEIIAGGLYVWKSTNGGKNFSQISNGNIKRGDVPAGEPEGDDSKYVHQNVHEIVYHPNNSNIIYFATDGGVFRTTDGGNTFEGCNGGYQTSNFYSGISISQQDKNFIIGGAHGNGTNIYNGTKSWKKYILPFDGGMTGINSVNENIVYSSYQNLNVFKSSDKGNSFGHLNIPGLGRETAYIAPFVVGVKDPKVIYAGRDKIYKSIDGGDSWYESNKGGELDGNPIVKMAIDPQNNNVVYAATFPFEQKDAGIKPGLFRTASDGETWTEVTYNLPDRFVGSIYIDHKGTPYVTMLGFGSSHLYYLKDAEQKWIDIGSGLPDVPTSAVVVDPENETHIYIGNDLGIFYSSDRGTTWENFSNGLFDAVMVTDLKIYKNERLIRAATNGAGFFERKLATEDPTKINDKKLPTELVLEQNYPNPFNPNTVISFVIPNFKNGFIESISLKVFDSLGRLITTLVNKKLSPGRHVVEFKSENLSSGVYYYRLDYGNFSITKKMLLVK